MLPAHIARKKGHDGVVAFFAVTTVVAYTNGSSLR